ncbi:MAG TPA: HAD-IC family P-type ATPase [Thermomicrobiaceae bacterium]|nr:HAD-IC family P-type ATPase [Thermomicrobiaceae bacterium]
MSAAVVETQVIHSLPGRLRLRLPANLADRPASLEERLRRIPGVRGVRVSPLTGTALVEFDPRTTDDDAILRAVGTAEPAPRPAPVAPAAHPRRWAQATRAQVSSRDIIRSRHGTTRRVRIPVTGMDRDPRVARAVVNRLRDRTGVQQVHANPLTGRVLVEFTEHEVDLQDLLSEVVDVELPPLPDEDRPKHPLDPAPLVQSAVQSSGAGLGLAVLAGQRLATAGQPLPGSSAAGEVAGVIGLVRSWPVTRDGIRRILGRHVADALFNSAAIVSLALADSPLGLAANAAEGLRLLTEVLARRRAFRQLEQDLHGVASTEPGALIRLDSGERTPRAAIVREGQGSAQGPDGLPDIVGPGDRVPAGERLSGGPFLLELQAHDPFTPEPRPAPITPGFYERYLQTIGPVSLGYAVLTGLATRSLSRMFEALLLVNPRPALIGKEAADTGASARVLRGGVVVVGTRPDRVIRLPGALLLDRPSLLTEGVELTTVLPLADGYETSDLLGIGAGVAAAAGSPWGGLFRSVATIPAQDGHFHRGVASGRIDRSTYTLRHTGASDQLPAVGRLRARGERALVLRREDDGQDLAVFGLRPRLRSGYAELVATCARHGVELGLLSRGDPEATSAVARRAGIPVVAEHHAVDAIRVRQRRGMVVAFASDNAEAAQGFDACDLAIGLNDRRSRLAARADLLVADLGGIGAIVEAGARRATAVRDSTVLSLASNAFGLVLGFRGAPGVQLALGGVYAAGLGALADGWVRLRGGERRVPILVRVAEPRPERWGQRGVAETLAALGSHRDGLSERQATERLQHAPAAPRQHPVIQSLVEQLTSPLTGLLAVGAGVSLLMSAPVDVAIIGATIAANVAVGTWQERQAGRAAEALHEMSAPTATVLRDGQPRSVAAREVVPGDVLLLAPGDRVVADARLLESNNLEVDESALTGESVPVVKAADAASPEGRVVLDGSDVTVGTGRAVVVAVGKGTRLGATAAALDLDGAEQSPLGVRLTGLLRQFLPLALAGGLVTAGAGLLRGASPLSQLGIGATIAVAAIPEGLPLLSRVAESAVSRRLIGRRALVRRLGAVEALGRVDVACTDKTGTLTVGRLAVGLVATAERDATLPGELDPSMRRVLLDAALASPSPDAADIAAHPTDVAVVEGAVGAGLGDELRQPRDAESPFESARSFHATQAGGCVYVKGAPETVVARCARVRRGDAEEPLDADGRKRLLARADELAARGLRVLMVAEGSAEAAVDNPRDLVATGFLGIIDPLRPDVRDAVRRCHDAGIRVIMLTGDHPETARAIGRQAGLLNGQGEVLVGTEIAQLKDGELDERLERATVIARATPLDKVRIVESLQRHGHTVAMTGDGVNDAPALRLADVGVAMGRGTEVARQAADIVLAADDFGTLVEALVEGRSFWRNIRRALGLLLGGNLGELGLLIGGSVLGLGSPMTTRQILAVNLITDVLPGLAVALQRPEHHNLAELSREGTAALDTTLRQDVLRRAVSSAGPSLAAYFAALALGLPEASTVAGASIVVTQLAQTLDVGRVEGSLSLPVVGAVGASAAVLAAAIAVPPLRTLLTLTVPSPVGWGLIGGAALLGLVVSRLAAFQALNPPALHLPSLHLPARASAWVAGLGAANAAPAS